MAWYDDALETLLGVFSPAEAEARIVTRDLEAQRLVEAMRSGAVLPSTPQVNDPLVRGDFARPRKQLHQEVVRAAEARPETVSVGYGTTPDMLAMQAAGMYDPRRQSIHVRNYGPPGQAPMPTDLRYQDTLAHELMHFILPLVAQDIENRRPELREAVGEMLAGDDREHALMGYMQGQERMPSDWQAYNKLRLFGRPPATTHPGQRQVLEEAMRLLLTNPALLQQALGGLQPRGAQR